VPPEFSEPVEVTDVLDLHGFQPGQIEEVVTEFIGHAARSGIRLVRIIHGKGKSRIKHEVRTVLCRSGLVEEFGDCSPDQGGWGATRAVINMPEEV